MRLYHFVFFSVFLLFGCDSADQNSGSSTTAEQPQGELTSPPITLVIHGGAGTIKKENLTDKMEQKYREKLSESLNAGFKVLSDGGKAIDAVIAAITIMEESELFNAGKGAVFTNEGKNELDASIMDGESGLAGAVAGVTNIKSPILAARAVMEHSPHVMLTGKGAEVFAEERGLEIVDPSWFYTERRFKSLERIRERENSEKGTSYMEEYPDYKFGTVGAVALDKDGNIVAGTSTGGMTNKKFGRVGDAPIIGAGTFADNSSCGISATGHGEFFIRNVVAYDISALMKYKSISLDSAAKEVVMNKLVEKGGSGGIIGLDSQGNVSMTFNSEGMYRGYINQAESKVAIFKED